MRITQTRTASLLLAFGFFFIASCGSQVHTIDAIRTQHLEGDARKALASTNQLLRDDPDNAQLLYLKAGILNDLAETLENPEDRFDYYREMRQSLGQMPDTVPPALSTGSRNLILTAWDREQRQAINRYSRLSTEPAPEEVEPVISHYENALIINPDSSKTWSLKATAHYQTGDLQGAVNTLTRAATVLDPVPAEMQEKLAFLLLEEGQLDSSIGIYRQLLDQDPDNDRIRHGLVNAYILNGEHENSIELLRELLENDPENLDYHEALATELFFHIQGSVREMIAAGHSGEEILDRQQALMDELDEAEEHYRIVQEEHPHRNEITFVTAAFYKNTAGHLMELADTQDEEVAEMLHQKARELLTRSIPVWKSVAERNPENPEIWRSIYQIYSHLNMDREAAEIRSKANL